MDDFNIGEMVLAYCNDCDDHTPHMYVSKDVWQCSKCNDIKMEVMMPEVQGLRMGRFGCDHFNHSN